MKRFIIKNADGTQQYVMPAVHDTRKKAEETLMGYIHSRNKFTEEYLSLFDFIIEVEKCDEPSKIIPNFKQAKQVIGSDEFILAKESFSFRDVEINYKHLASLIAINQLFNIAEGWMNSCLISRIVLKRNGFHGSNIARIPKNLCMLA